MENLTNKELVALLNLALEADVINETDFIIITKEVVKTQRLLVKLIVNQLDSNRVLRNTNSDLTFYKELNHTNMHEASKCL